MLELLVISINKVRLFGLLVFLFPLLLAHNFSLEEEVYSNSISSLTCGQVTNVGGTISQSTTWTKSNLYVLNSDVVIPENVTLTIDPGAIIKAKDNIRIFVDGRINVGGTQDEPVFFTSWKDDEVCGDTNNDGNATVPLAGDWGWLELRPGSDNNSSIQRAVFKYAGNVGVLWNGAIMVGKVSPTLEYITFEDNFRNAVEAQNGNWNTAFWNSTTVVYWLRDDVRMIQANTLTISPGAKVKFADNANIYIDGKLIANGTETNPIYFTSERDDEVCGIGAFGEEICDTNNDGNATVPLPGDWGWLELRLGSDNNSSIQRAVFRYAGNVGVLWNGAIIVGRNSPTLEYITFEDNFRNAVEVQNGNWNTAFWKNKTVVYWLRDDIFLNQANTLTISPGAKVKFADNANIYIDGKLIANGTETNPIYFTSERDDDVCGIGAFGEEICDTNNDGNAAAPLPGDWGWIELRSGSDNNSSIQRTVFKYAGNVGVLWNGALLINKVSPTVSFSRFTKNHTGMVIQNGSQANLICNDFIQNDDYGIYNSAGISVFAERQWWGHASGPTYIGNPTGQGDKVSVNVDFIPWATTPCTSSLNLDYQTFLPFILK